MGECQISGVGLICLCGVFGCSELASGGVGRLTHVDYFRGLVDLELMVFAAILHLSETILT